MRRGWWYYLLANEMWANPDPGLNAWFWMPKVYRLAIPLNWHEEAPLGPHYWPPDLIRDFLEDCERYCRETFVTISGIIRGGFSLAILLGILVPLATAVGRVSDLLASITGTASGGRPCPVLRT